VTIVPVRVFECSQSTSLSIVLAGIDWVIADHPAGRPAVVNMSLGGGASDVLDAAVTAMINDGITVVVSAGNDAAPSCNQSPARVPAAITVAASTTDDDDADFSNFGPCNDLFAPGVDITSASYLSDTGTAVMNGTSMASPHVAGAAALILERSPTATPAQVWAAIDADTTKGVLTECCGDPDKLLHVVTPTDPPPGLTAAVAPASGVRSGQVRVAWAAPRSNGSPITDYTIQRSLNGTTWTTLSDGVSTARAFTVTGLVNGTPYRFRVSARNALGFGPWSATAGATPRWKPTAPRRLAAAGAPARGVGSRQVKLTWRAPLSNRGARITDYVIQRSVNGRKWTTVRDGVSVRRSVLVSRLTNGTQYRFRVAAKNVVGRGPWSRVDRATPHAP
jgi:subtilisin family serine protease